MKIINEPIKSEFCVGELCNSDPESIELAREPFRTMRQCEDLTKALYTGDYLSIEIYFSCSPEFIAHYSSMENILRSVNSMFPMDDLILRDDIENSRVLMSFELSHISGFSIPLLTLKLDVFSRVDVYSLVDIADTLHEQSLSRCGTSVKTQFRSIHSLEELRSYVYHRMTRFDEYDNSKEVSALLQTKDRMRLNWFLATPPVAFDATCLIDLEKNQLGVSMMEMDEILNSVFLRWQA